MSLQDASELTQCHEFALGEITKIRQDHVQCRIHMPFGEDKTVSFIPFRILRILFHHMIVKYIQYVKTGQGSTRMA